jgi:hypothetical protein
MRRHFLSVSIDTPHTYVRATELGIGQLGVTTDGTVLLRTYTSVIKLSDPHTTWSIAEFAPEVRILPAGSKVTITVL